MCVCVGGGGVEGVREDWNKEIMKAGYVMIATGTVKDSVLHGDTCSYANMHSITVLLTQYRQEISFVSPDVLKNYKTLQNPSVMVFYKYNLIYS